MDVIVSNFSRLTSCWYGFVCFFLNFINSSWNFWSQSDCGNASLIHTSFCTVNNLSILSTTSYNLPALYLLAITRIFTGKDEMETMKLKRWWSRIDGMKTMKWTRWNDNNEVKEMERKRTKNINQKIWNEKDATKMMWQTSNANMR